MGNCMKSQPSDEDLDETAKSKAESIDKEEKPDISENISTVIIKQEEYPEKDSPQETGEVLPEENNAEEVCLDSSNDNKDVPDISENISTVIIKQEEYLENDSPQETGEVLPEEKNTEEVSLDNSNDNKDVVDQ
ncbi:uncharacterized protein LOC111641184 isoform X1 [Centruroides sculpturatus]|uniref:uncharacterized protein LOC111641184 isoform X1 n=1 Tax=Centruroides sculpturatus TaxID=218467 RepID=UPI000C6D5374|nr:uncharacterized protein LOC111641184 isoform X1 [Centruroides sculpturatus]